VRLPLRGGADSAATVYTARETGTLRHRELIVACDSSRIDTLLPSYADLLSFMLS
jgi:hypothetical protein